MKKHNVLWSSDSYTGDFPYKLSRIPIMGEEIVKLRETETDDVRFVVTNVVHNLTTDTYSIHLKKILD